jgi:hypothetical protein
MFTFPPVLTTWRFTPHQIPLSKLVIDLDILDFHIGDRDDRNGESAHIG